ncbi:alpha/beta hydrolase [Alphaproteobacteria bacterium]|jgi:pimeloyl-ACP methyl ester carboxylesterase|nr:alpha/beta hydrolase [Alphaproteobacteria bacterium]MDB2388425.1 alpha/beta hydrolase [Alphaproteobacteria bacterium]
MNKKTFNFEEFSNYLSAIEKNCNKVFIKSKDSKVCWRSWGKGKPLILLHGGYGSWAHWIKQAIPFSKNYNVLIPDMPGFGESEDLTLPHTPEKISANIAETLLKLISPEETPIICGFSFGGLIAGHLSYNLIERGLNPEKLILVGPGGLGAKRGKMRNMIARHSKMSEEEIYQAHKTNLEILMMHDATKVDDWSVHIQKQNTDAHRIKSRPISSTDTLARILEKQDVPLFLLWGEKDASVGVYLEDRMSILRDINSKVRFHVEYNLGHWIMYENDVIFNKILNNFIQD